jgi:hypothetical protein
MKQITINAYSFNELSDKAKDKARDYYYENINYFWDDEHLEGVKRFLELFNVSLINWAYDEYHADFETDINDCKFQSMNKNRVNALIKSFNVSYCADETLVIAFNESYSEHGSIKLAIEEALRQSEIDLKNDIAYHYTDESMADYFEANEYFFTQGGKII